MSDTKRPLLVLLVAFQLNHRSEDSENVPLAIMFRQSYNTISLSILGGDLDVKFDSENITKGINGRLVWGFGVRRSVDFDFTRWCLSDKGSDSLTALGGVEVP